MVLKMSYTHQMIGPSKILRTPDPPPPEVGTVWRRIRKIKIGDNTTFPDGTDSNSEVWGKVVIRKIIPQGLSDVDTVVYSSMLGESDSASVVWFIKYYEIVH